MNAPEVDLKEKIDFALQHAADCFDVIPLIENGKKPVFRGWQDWATQDPETIRAHYRDSPRDNIGIVTGRQLSNGKYLFVVDRDVKNGVNGHRSLQEQELMHGRVLTPTKSVSTATEGGQQDYYFTEKPLRGRVGILPGLDGRGAGNLVAAVGSVVNGRMYKSLNDLPMMPLDPWFVDLLEEAETVPLFSEEECSQLPPDFNMERAKAHTIQHFKKAKPVGEGGRNNQLHGLISDARGFGVLMPFAIEAYEKYVNPRHSPPLGHDEVCKTARSVYRNRRRVIGDTSPESIFAKQQSDLEPLQKEYSILISGGEAQILWDTHDSKGREVLEFLSIPAFKIKMAAKKGFDGKKEVPLSSLFLEDAATQRFDGLEFDPQHGPIIDVERNGSRRRFRNLWTGFAYEPAPSGASCGAVARFIEHIQLGMCDGDEALFRWVFGFFAHLIQKTWEKPGVAIVLLGDKGTGKTFITEIFGALCGKHASSTSNPRYVTGNFNGHLENNVLLTFDEAFWCGNKQVDGIVKGLITSSHHNIERKGLEPFSVRNLTRLIIISNEDEAVRATSFERRYAVLTVNNRRRQDTAFFGSIQEGMEAGGYRVLLRTLLDFNLEGLNFNVAPKTQGLLQQKVLSLEPWKQYWFSCLHDGQILGLEHEGWPETISCKRFQQAVKDSLRDRNIHGWLPSSVTIGQKMRPLGLRWQQQRVPQEKRLQGDPEFNTVYVIPPLAEARRLFNKDTEQEFEWP